MRSLMRDYAGLAAVEFRERCSVPCHRAPPLFYTTDVY